MPHTPHDSVATLASACDIVALCLPDDADVWHLLEQQGLLHGLKPGAIVVNHGTGDPAENRRIAQRLLDAGHAFLDAPVSGGRPAAIARTLTTIAGGERTAFERCVPVFDTFSRKVAFMGPAGSGQLAQLLNNAFTMTNLSNVAGVLHLDDKLGMDIASLVDVVCASSGSSTILAATRDFTPQLAILLQGLMKKDIAHFADGMKRYGLDATELAERGLQGARALNQIVTVKGKDFGRARSLLA